jgi:hypothetical protein
MNWTFLLRHTFMAPETMYWSMGNVPPRFVMKNGFLFERLGMTAPNTVEYVQVQDFAQVY